MYTPPVNIFRNISRNMVSLAEAVLFKMAEIECDRFRFYKWS